MNPITYDSLIDKSLLLKYPNLKKQIKAGDNFNKKEVWTKENLIDGFKKFFDEHQRYPIAEEIDDSEYLPSSRQIQKASGG